MSEHITFSVMGADGGQAFPYVRAADTRHVETGMTLRDYFAAKAMPEMAWAKGDEDGCARQCYVVADAMLKARQK